VPKRTREHVVADRAIAAVVSVIAKAGHAAEAVTNDYGEDLLVQTSHKDRMDSSRLWFQVKGTENISRHRLKSGEMSFSVSFDHAARWARSADLVVVVLWDVERGEGWYALPRRQIDAWQDMTSGSHTATLRFSEDAVLSTEAVNLLAWESRIDHYRMLILHARAIEEETQDQSRSLLRIVIALDFMEMLEVVEREGEDGVRFRVREEVISRFLGACFQLRGECEPDEVVDLAAVWTILSQAYEVSAELGLPGLLAEDMADALVGLLGLKELSGTLSPDNDFSIFNE
jgi:Domain of unknown function (DUF4365)